MGMRKFRMGYECVDCVSRNGRKESAVGDNRDGETKYEDHHKDCDLQFYIKLKPGYGNEYAAGCLYIHEHLEQFSHESSIGSINCCRLHNSNLC